MSNRIPLIAASTGAVLALVVGLAAAGFAPGAADATTVSSTTTTTEPAAAEPTVQVDTIYVAPPPPQKTITIQEVSKTSNGDSDDGEESGEDD